MKRRKPLVRRTPLRASTPARTPTTGARPRQRRTAARQLPRMDTRLRADVFARAGNRCERCGTRATVDTGHAHHRQLRSRGGLDTHANLVALCARCHEWAHANPALATAAGLMVPSWADPADVPVIRHDGRTYYARPHRWVPTPIEGAKQ